MILINGKLNRLPLMDDGFDYTMRHFLYKKNDSVEQESSMPAEGYAWRRKKQRKDLDGCKRLGKIEFGASPF